MWALDTAASTEIEFDERNVAHVMQPRGHVTQSTYMLFGCVVSLHQANRLLSMGSIIESTMAS